MSECVTNRHQLVGKQLNASGALLCALLGGASLGCSAFAPSALGNLAASREEKRVLKQAAVESFPSPSDVGLAKDDGENR